MPKGSPKNYTEVVSLKLSSVQKDWLDRKTLEETRRRGRTVPATVIIRALIQRQMDYEKEAAKVWDG
jgi:hypothetical protein